MIFQGVSLMKALPSVQLKIGASTAILLHMGILWATPSVSGFRLSGEKGSTAQAEKKRDNFNLEFQP